MYNKSRRTSVPISLNIGTLTSYISARLLGCLRTLPLPWMTSNVHDVARQIAHAWENIRLYMCAVLWGISRLMTKPTKWHPPSLIKVFAVRMKNAWVLSYLLSAQRWLWSDWADAQADLSLRWAHMPFCWFCHEAARIFLVCIIQLSFTL